MEPLAVAIHAVEQSGMKKGDTALVLGAGPIGCFVIKTLIAKGASYVPFHSLSAALTSTPRPSPTPSSSPTNSSRNRQVICSEPSSSRRNMAELAGAHLVLSPFDAEEFIPHVKKVSKSGEGVDVSFECAGVQATINTAIKCLRPKVS